jgi:hypothetical protein
VILSEIIDGPDDPADKAKDDAQGAEQCKEDPRGGHTKNARPSSTPKHQKGDARRKKDQGGEKGDARRPYQR